MNADRRRRLTPLGTMPPLAAIVLGGLAVLTGDGWLLLLAGGALGLLGAAVVLPPRLTDLRIEVRHARRVTVGDELLWHAHVTNQSTRRTSQSRLLLSQAGLSDAAVLIPPIRPGGCVCTQVIRQVTARTAAQPGSLVLASSEPLGLLELRSNQVLASVLIAHPRQVPVHLGELRAAEDGTGQAMASRAGLDVHGIREWRSGDGASQVHWRSTARRGRLVVLERETRMGGGFALLVVGPPGQPSWEPLVALAASTIVAAAGIGRRVGVYAAQPDLPDLTSTNRNALLDWCSALTEPSLPEPSLVARAVRFAGSGGDLVVAATALPPTWWASTHAAARAVGAQVRVLTSDPAR